MTTRGPLARPDRLPALRRFAIAITLLNVLGHTVLGFEQSPAQPLAALATAYGMELLLEAVGSRAERRPPRFAGGPRELVDFLLAAHISGLAVAMLLDANDEIGPIVFATTVAIGSKVLVRVPIGRGSRHCLNPSNTGIAATLLLFPRVGIAPPYMFTENVSGWGDWVLPAIVASSGTFLNVKFTGRGPLIVGWLGGFFLQALLRSRYFGTPLAASLLPMTGLAFLLFTFYMVTDPGTTPGTARGQLAFGAAVAAAYSALMVLHVVFGLFFALFLVSAFRGLGLTAVAGVRSLDASRDGARAPVCAAMTPNPAALEVVER